MLFKSPVYSQASGSVAGLVYSHNAGGMYVRARATPTNPNSEPQQAVRDALRVLNDRWTFELTNVQREAWNNYAFNTPTLNRLGESTTKTGQNMYIRGNVSRLQAGLPVADAAPVVFDTGSFTEVGPLIADASADTISIGFSDLDAWANEDDAAMLVYMGRPQNKTRNFGKGPFQLLTAILGDSGTPPTSPVVAASLFPLAEPQKVFLQEERTVHPEWLEMSNWLHGVDLDRQDHIDTVSTDMPPQIFLTLWNLRRYELRDGSFLPACMN